VFGNRVLWRKFGPKREEVAGGWRKLHIEELYTFQISRNNVTAIKSRKMRGAEHVERVGEMRKHIKFCSENVKGTDNSEDLGVDGKIILEWIFGGRLWSGFI
jgi:hypothetical protein